MSHREDEILRIYNQAILPDSLEKTDTPKRFPSFPLTSAHEVENYSTGLERNLILLQKEINDLLLPFRHLRKGKGLGSLFCLRAVDEPSTPDPSEGNLNEFQVLFGDTYA